MDFDDERAERSETWIFHEFDECPQDENLYVLPPEILSSCNEAK